MKKIINIVLSLATLLAMTLQGQSLFNCHSEETIHLSSSCCDSDSISQKSCCSEEKDAHKKIKSKCCSVIDLEFAHNLTLNNFEIAEANFDSPSLPFYVELEESSSILESEVIKVKNLDYYSPPSQSPPYILFCSFLC